MSVLSQTFNDFEIIVVNDGSTDGSLAEVNSIQDGRITVFTIENQGVSNARNYGIGKAKSDLIPFLDADDLWKPNHLENLKHLYEQFPDCGVYAAAYEFQFGTKKIASLYYGVPKTEHWIGIVDDFFESSTINCIAYTSAVMIPKKVCEELGGFNSNYTSGEDTDLWIRIALKYPVAFTNSVSVIIHMTAENQITKTSIETRKHFDLEKFIEEERTNKTLKKYLDLNRFSIAIQHKIAGNHLISKDIINNIDTHNLNAKQRFLLQMNTQTLKTFIKIKDLLRKNGIGLSAFR